VAERAPSIAYGPYLRIVEVSSADFGPNVSREV
jgi:hypothetical protein